VLFLGLLLLFFGLFFRWAPLEETNSAIFRYFLLISGLFFVAPPPTGKFSANALVSISNSDTGTVNAPQDRDY